MSRPHVRNHRTAVAIAALVSLVVGAGIVLWIRHSSAPDFSGPPCLVTSRGTTYAVGFEQTANATTIAAVGKAKGLPDHAVSIALAAALQESRLHNISHGDRDSLGLFQQRPSQGWGTPTQILTPSYAAGSFYDHLQQVPGWQTMAVTEAAQAVQHSGAPSAYSQWEPKARALASVLTGEEPAGLACHFPSPSNATPSAQLATAMAQELGSPNVDVPVPAARGWTVAGWLIGHARQYGVAKVSFDGRQWTANRGSWKPSSSDTSSVVTID